MDRASSRSELVYECRVDTVGDSVRPFWISVEGGSRGPKPTVLHEDDVMWRRVYECRAITVGDRVITVSARVRSIGISVQGGSRDPKPNR